jgi:hypothetical protein
MPDAVKDQLELKLEHSATPGATVTAKVYQNDIASTSGITSDDTDYSGSTVELEAHSQGKLFKLELTLPAEGAGLANINYRYNVAGWKWSERFRK